MNTQRLLFAVYYKRVITSPTIDRLWKKRLKICFENSNLYVEIHSKKRREMANTTVVCKKHIFHHYVCIYLQFVAQQTQEAFKRYPVYIRKLVYCTFFFLQQLKLLKTTKWNIQRERERRRSGNKDGIIINRQLRERIIL